jgi:hypothetical protein
MTPSRSHHLLPIALFTALVVGHPGIAHATSCEQILALLDSGAPVDVVIKTLQESKVGFTLADIQCLEKADAPQAVVDEARKAVPAGSIPLEPNFVAPSWSRLALNTTITGLGVAMGVGSLYNFTQAGEAYEVYGGMPRSAASTALYDAEVRPRLLVAETEAVAAIGLVGASIALWKTTEHIDGLKSRSIWPRYALDTAVTGVGAGMGFAAWFNACEATKAYGDYVGESNPRKAKDILDEEVKPRQTAAIVEGVIAAGGLGVGAWLWSRSPGVQVAAGPGTVILGFKW